jgi:hypothetical protein
MSFSWTGILLGLRIVLPEEKTNENSVTCKDEQQYNSTEVRATNTLTLLMTGS